MSKRFQFRPLAALASYMKPPPALREEGMFALRRERLANGLRVWVKSRPGTATVFLLLQVPVGSRHESKDNNGISHFVEHMLFTGTAKWSEEEVTEIIRRRGGDANARTAREDTVFWLHLKADDLDLGLEWLAEVAFRPELPEAKFNKERQVIIQEKGGEIGALESVGELIEDAGLGWDVFRAVFHRLYPKSSMLLPVIGEARSLRRITYRQVVDFYRQHYVPNNMTLIVVGDVKADEVLARAAAHLGVFPAGAVPPRPQTPPAAQGGFNLRLRGPNFSEQGQLLLGAPLPGASHPDRWVLSILCEILDSRLTRDIRLNRGLVYGIDVYSALYSDVGQFVVYTTADSDKFEEILAEVEAQLEQAIRGEIDQAAVAEAKAAVQGRLLLAMESNGDLAWWLAGASLYLPEQAAVPDLYAEFEAVTPEAVTRVARTYLTRDKRYRAIHRPGVTPGSLARPALVGLGLALTGASAWLWTRARGRPLRPKNTRLERKD